MKHNNNNYKKAAPVNILQLLTNLFLTCLMIKGSIIIITFICYEQIVDIKLWFHYFILTINENSLLNNLPQLITFSIQKINLFFFNELSISLRTVQHLQNFFFTNFSEEVENVDFVELPHVFIININRMKLFNLFTIKQPSFFLELGQLTHFVFIYFAFWLFMISLHGIIINRRSLILVLLFLELMLLAVNFNFLMSACF